jgi:4-hydroxy-tetrahydrodipicolinate reductase
MTLRVIQWGTGNVGRHALRTIVDRTDLSLVGLRVYNPDKVGRDAGELLGRARIGVEGTDDLQAILDLDADCVCYTALGSTLPDAEGPLDDICALLASGKNVVSSAVEFHAYFRPGFHLDGAGADAYVRMSEACRIGHSSFFHVGINPGYAMDLWPIVLARMSQRIDRLVITEVVDMARYTSSHMVRDAIGFGLAPEVQSPVDRNNSNVYQSAFFVSMKMLADALGLTLEEVRYRSEVAVTHTPIEIAAGTIDAGTVAVKRMAYDGIVHGRAVLVLELLWRISDDVAPEWPTSAGGSRWIAHIEGEPTIDSEIVLSTDQDAGRATSLSVATLLVNSIPTVVAADPGLLDNLTIAMHAGGYVNP